MINPSHLRTYCSLVETKHFTRTAELLFMTQSGVSQHIKKLEAQLGLALILRKDKSFELTDAGKKLYEEARDIVFSLEELRSKVRDDEAFEGEVKLMSPGSVGLKINRNLLSLQQRYPDLVINHRFAPNKEIERNIDERQCDIGLMTRIPDIESCSFKHISDEALLLVTPQGAPCETLDDLHSLGFIDHPDGHHHANLLLSQNFSDFTHISEFKKRGFSNQIHLILEPVSLGIGFTVLPENAVHAFLNQNSIRAQALPNAVSEPLYLVRKQIHALPKRVESIVNMLDGWFEEDGA